MCTLRNIPEVKFVYKNGGEKPIHTVFRLLRDIKTRVVEVSCLVCVTTSFMLFYVVETRSK